MLDALLDDEPVASAAATEPAPADAEPPLVLGLVEELDAAPEPQALHLAPPEAEALEASEPALASDAQPEPDPDLASSMREPPPDPAPVAATAPPAPSWPAPRDEAPSWPEPPPVVPLAGPPPPGSYLPPTVAAATAAQGTAVAAMPAGPAAPARAWAGAGGDAAPADPAVAEAAHAERARVEEMIGWVAVAGCALALLGFLIPWARTMIGSGGTGYLDQWGLAGSGHVLIVLAIGAIVLATVVPNRIPARYRLGIPGLIVGAILIGLVWPYVLGPLGALPGAFLSLVGAFTLVGAAIATLVVDRHAGRGSGV